MELAAALAEKQRRLKVRTSPWRTGDYFVRDDGHLYVPNPGQQLFHESGVRYKALVGGRGSGKSTAGAQEALRRIRRGLPGLVLNPDFENFKLSTWPEFKRWIAWEHVIARDQRMGEFGWEPTAPFVIHFDNGATVNCKGLRDVDSARGPNVNWLWYDEGQRDRTGASWKVAIGGVRVGPDPSAWVTMTPRGKRHWTFKMFVQQEVPAEVQVLLDELGYRGPLYEYHHASIHDNRANLDPLFYASMMTAYTGKWGEQELEGLFVETAEGLVYEEFGADNISALADYEKKRGPVEIAYDDGFAHSPRVFLFIQVDDKGVVNIFDELYHTRHLPAVCISEAKAMAKGYGIEHFEIAVGDPSAVQLAEALRQADIPARGGSAGVIEGINNIRRLVRGADGKVGLRVHSRCRNFIREMGEDYQYPEGAKGDEVKPVKEEDHGPDAIREWAWMRMRRR